MNQYNRDMARQQAAVRRGQVPTIEDFRALVDQYQKLHAVYERQSEELAEAKKQLHIKSEALAMQNEDIKRLSAELAFVTAAVQQQEETAIAEEETVDWEEQYVRMQAEMENLRKRWEQRLTTEVGQARHRILLDMLPLADHLEMALNHADTGAEDGQGNSIQNMRATQKAFQDTLKRYNVISIEADRQPFDPNLHEAIGQMASDDVSEGDVAAVVQTGYLEGEQLLRPARVMVSSGSAAQ